MYLCPPMTITIDINHVKQLTQSVRCSKIKMARPQNLRKSYWDFRETLKPLEVALEIASKVTLLIWPCSSFEIGVKIKGRV